MVTRKEILRTAENYVTKDRADTHGNMEDNFATIAEYWTIHLGYKVTPIDVGVMMALLKMARVKASTQHLDNYVDGAGYLACAGELSTRGQLDGPDNIRL